MFLYIWINSYISCISDFYQKKFAAVWKVVNWEVGWKIMSLVLSNLKRPVCWRMWNMDAVLSWASQASWVQVDGSNMERKRSRVKRFSFIMKWKLQSKEYTDLELDTGTTGLKMLGLKGSIATDSRWLECLQSLCFCLGIFEMSWSGQKRCYFLLKITLILSFP